MDDDADQTLITKILGEMKHQFNNKVDVSDGEGETPEPPEEPGDDVLKIEPENGKDPSDESSLEAEEQPRIVMLFRKPDSISDRPTKANRRSKRNQTQDLVEVKRSTRRRSKECGESVLQSAIARKEKSYNEFSKPQRLTRQLKPTQKILDNIASAAALKEKRKDRGGKGGSRVRGDSDEDEALSLMFTERNNKVKNNKKLKTNYVTEIKEDADAKAGKSDPYNSNSNTSMEDTEEDLPNEKMSDGDAEQEAEAKDESIVIPESKPLLSDLILASRLCLCTSIPNIYGFANPDEELFCMGLDSIGDKTVGCSNSVTLEKTPMLRPSTKVPYSALCNLHYKRMLRHQCCPTCGLFCTQGRFVQCKNKHNYHKDCRMTFGDSDRCPHCGDSNPPRAVEISMTTPEPPLFSTAQKSRRESEDCSANVKRECAGVACPPSPPIIPVDHLRLGSGGGKCCTDSDELDNIQELLGTIREGDCEKLARIIGTVDANLLDSCISYDGEVGTVLHYAVKQGPTAILHVLNAAQADLDALDGEQNTALMVAVMNFRNEAVKYLTRAGASVTTKCMDGMTAIHLAAKCGNLEASKILLSSASHVGNYINCADDGGWTPLVWACHHNHVTVVKYLLSEGADPLLTDVEQNVALHWAAFGGSSKIVELILNFGGQVNIANSHGDTPLHIAARQDNYNCVLTLLARCAQIDAINKLEESPIHCCPEASKSFEVLLLNQQLQAYINVSQKQQTFISNDISNGKEASQIPCLNDADDEKIPSDYLYVTKNCATADINIDLKITSLKSCTCKDRCGTRMCSCGLLSGQCWYEQGRLAQNFNYEDPPVIFECNEVCTCCAITCNNRLVQKGSLQKFQLFRTNCKGWGIRAARVIPCGTYVSEYIGELITDTEADSREDDSYMFDLDNKDCNTYCIDAKFYGNFTRFINHSCSPNLVLVRVFVDHHDLKFPRIALFANRDIAVNEELSFDYGEKFWLIKYKYFTCECESLSCKYSKEAISETLNSYYARLPVG